MASKRTLAAPAAEFLHKYTNLAATIDLLKRQQLSLLTPQLWDDWNDRFFMEEYQKRKSLKTVLAACFCQSSESYHHWKVFSSGMDGVRIEFDKLGLLEDLDKYEGIIHKDVSYPKIAVAGLVGVNADDLPFTKRHPFRDEKEYRAIYCGRTASFVEQFDIQLSNIRRVTLSPWIPKNLAQSVRQTLKSIKGCSKIQIYRSTLIENENWKKIARAIS